MTQPHEENRGTTVENSGKFKQEAHNQNKRIFINRTFKEDSPARTNRQTGGETDVYFRIMAS